MRRRTKVVLLAMVAGIAIIPATTNFDVLDGWPRVSVIQRLYEATNPDEVISLLGRRPDLVIPPNPGAKRGIEQWVWTKDRNRKKDPFNHRNGWVRFFVLDGKLVLNCDCFQSQSSFLEILKYVKLVYQRSSSLAAFLADLKETWDPYPASSPLCGPNLVLPPSDPRLEPPLTCPHSCKVGDIKIIGNDLTTDANILDLLGLHPGQLITKNDLIKAEIALADSGLFSFGPTVRLIDPDVPSELKDILVTVNERFHPH